MKNVLFIFAIFFLSCISNKEKTKKIENQIVKSNLYDLYYIKLLEENKNFNTINIDSLRTKEVKEILINKAIANLALDSIFLKKITSKVKSNKSFAEIQISDSIKKKIRSKDRKLNVIDFFSEPIKISKTQKIILFEKQHQLGRCDGAVFFSKNPDELWKLDSTVVLNNYRGGGLDYR